MIYFCTGTLFQCVSYLLRKSNNALISWNIKDDPKLLTLASCHSAVEGFNCSISHTDQVTQLNTMTTAHLTMRRHILPYQDQGTFCHRISIQHTIWYIPWQWKGHILLLKRPKDIFCYAICPSTHPVIPRCGARYPVTTMAWIYPCQQLEQGTWD